MTENHFLGEKPSAYWCATCHTIGDVQLGLAKNKQDEYLFVNGHLFKMPNREM